MKLSESRLKNKSQMYETTRDHGFGLNAYLYSATGEFLGICLDTVETITAACCKKDSIHLIKRGLNPQVSAEPFYKLANMARSKTAYYEMHKNDIWWVHKNFAELWVRENIRGKYNKYEVIKIYDRWNRLVLDNETHKYYQLHIIPKDFRLVLKRVPIVELQKHPIHRRGNYTVVELNMESFPMPKHICDTDERKSDVGYCIFSYLTGSQYAFKMPMIWKVIQKLEKLGFRFEKNNIYKTAICFSK